MFYFLIVHETYLPWSAKVFLLRMG